MRYRLRSPDNSRAGAAAWEDLLRERLARGESLVGQTNDAPTLSDFAREWLETYVKANNKPSEQHTKAIQLRKHILPAFGNLRLTAITAERIERYKAQKITAGLSAKSVNNQLTILSKCLKTAATWGVIEAAPSITWLKPPPPSFDFLTFDESRRLVEAIDEPKWRAMVVLALRTGLRLGEMLGLEWSDVDLAARRITVRRNIVLGNVGSPKSNRIRYVPLSSDACLALQSLPRTSESVFAASGGRPTWGAVATHALARYCQRAGLRKVGWHALRHTFASHLAMENIPLLAIKDFLGHATVQMTMRYAHLAPSTTHGFVEVLDRVTAPPLGQPAVSGGDEQPLSGPTRDLRVGYA